MVLFSLCSYSLLTPNVLAAELRPKAVCSSSVFARRRRRTRCASDASTFLTTACGREERSA